jgi:class 3 adenylate cyclase
VRDVVVDTVELPAAEQARRLLATVLFTDIVNSTERARAVGDQRWRELLDRHDQAARRLVERHGGRLIKSTGDGILAVFDGPGRGIRCALALTIQAAEALHVDCEDAPVFRFCAHAPTCLSRRSRRIIPRWRTADKPRRPKWHRQVGHSR